MTVSDWSSAKCVGVTIIKNTWTETSKRWWRYLTGRGHYLKWLYYRGITINIVRCSWQNKACNCRYTPHALFSIMIVSVTETRDFCITYIICMIHMYRNPCWNGKVLRVTPLFVTLVVYLKWITRFIYLLIKIYLYRITYSVVQYTLFYKNMVLLRLVKPKLQHGVKYIKQNVWQLRKLEWRTLSQHEVGNTKKGTSSPICIWKQSVQWNKMHKS